MSDHREADIQLLRKPSESITPNRNNMQCYQLILGLDKDDSTGLILRRKTVRSVLIKPLKVVVVKCHINISD